MVPIATIIILGCVLLIGIEIIIAMTGPSEVFKNPDRKPRTFGSVGPPLKYLVMGDSTAAGQGSDYEKGFAVQTAKHLAKNYRVTTINTGISGAKVHDVLENQVTVAEHFKPDLVIISMTANDTVKLTSLESIEKDAQLIVKRILAANCNAKIVMTGSPDMGTVRRFYPPLNQLASWHSKRVTNTMKKVIAAHALTYAPAFEEVGPPFYENPTLLAEDRYHPNEQGYMIWTEMWNKAIDKALKEQLTHCNNSLSSAK